MVNENNRKKQNLRSVDIAIKNECPVWKTLKNWKDQHQEMSQCDSRCVNKMKKNSLYKMLLDVLKKIKDIDWTKYLATLYVSIMTYWMK